MQTNEIDDPKFCFGGNIYRYLSCLINETSTTYVHTPFMESSRASQKIKKNV